MVVTYSASKWTPCTYLLMEYTIEYLTVNHINGRSHRVLQIINILLGTKRFNLFTVP